MLQRQATVPRMRRLWICAAIAFAGGLAFGPRLLHLHRHGETSVAIAHRDIAHLDAANYWRWHHASHVHTPYVLDPWGTPYRMSPSGQGFAITSAGPDRTFGTADDVR